MLLRAPTVLLFYCLTHFLAVSATSDPIIKIRDFEKCECDGKNPLKWNFSFNNVDSAEWKALDLDIDLDEDLTENWSFTLSVDKMNNGDWETDLYQDEGKLCELITKFAKGAWQKLMSSVEPNVHTFCQVKKGHYTLKGFEVFKHEVDIKSTMYGSQRLTLKVMNDKGDNVMCARAYVDVSDK